MPKIMLAHTVCFFFLGSILSDFEGSLGFFTFGDGGRGVETENPGQIHWYYNLVLNKTNIAYTRTEASFHCKRQYRGQLSNYASRAFFWKKDENYAGNDKLCQKLC